MSFPQILGLPSSVDFKMPPSIADGCRSYSVHQAPDGITSVVSSAAPAPFVANSSCAFTPFGGGQIISFSLPCGMGSNVFMSPQDTTVSFNLTYTTTSAVVSATAPTLNLISSGASFFDTLTVYSNSVPIEQITGYNQLQHFLLQTMVNLAERAGGLSIAMGCDTNSATGIDLGYAASTTYRYSFCIPLMSILGYNADKLIPIGSVSNLQLQLGITNGHFPIVSSCTALTTNPVLGAFTLDNFSLNMKYIDLGEISGAILKQTLQDGKWFVRATTYTQSSSSLASGSFANNQLLLQIRNSSVRSVLHYFNTTALPAVCASGIYDAIGVNALSRQCQVGGAYYPNRPLNDVNRTGEAYCYLIQALNGVSSPVKALGTVINREMYNSQITTPLTTSETVLVAPATGVRANSGNNNGAFTNIALYPSSAFYGYDFERVQGALLSGINTRASPPFLNLNIGVALPCAMTCSSWGMSDVILAFDVNSQSVQAYI